MKVILLQDVKTLGKKGVVVEVSEGYARNVLLKKGLAKEATSQNMNDLKLQKANEEKVAKETLAAAQKLGGELDGREIGVAVKTGSAGRVFGSVSSREIAEGIRDQLGLEIDRRKILLDSPIKTLGTTEVAVRLHTKVTVRIKVNVTALA